MSSIPSFPGTPVPPTVIPPKPTLPPIDDGGGDNGGGSSRTRLVTSSDLITAGIIAASLYTVASLYRAYAEAQLAHAKAAQEGENKSVNRLAVGACALGKNLWRDLTFSWSDATNNTRENGGAYHRSLQVADVIAKASMHASFAIAGSALGFRLSQADAYIMLPGASLLLSFIIAWGSSLLAADDP